MSARKPKPTPEVDPPSEPAPVEAVGDAAALEPGPKTIKCYDPRAIRMAGFMRSYMKDSKLPVGIVTVITDDSELGFHITSRSG